MTSLIHLNVSRITHVITCFSTFFFLPDKIPLSESFYLSVSQVMGIRSVFAFENCHEQMLLGMFLLALGEGNKATDFLGYVLGGRTAESNNS